MKHIFVTGGVVSGLGKGICAASLGRLLKQRGFRVKNQKFDPYFNVDPGTMSPFQHGEVFVTDDGAETDLDLGHYERFVDESLTGNASVSSGKVFWNVLNRERQGGYLGGTVQIIPHVTDEIKRRIYAMDDGETDIIITEVGGTVGDIESQPYLEAIRQVAAEKGRENVLYIHVPLVVSIPGTGELKSKPTQHSVKELLSVGIQPDILVCRTDSPLPEDLRRKIALFCNMEEDCVIQNLTASTLYEVPLLLEREGLCRVACRKLGLPQREPDLAEWTALVQRINGVHKTVQIALVGKYTGLHDAYLSVAESLFHAGTACDARVNIKWVDSEGPDGGEREAGAGGLQRHSGARRLRRPGHRGDGPGGAVRPGEGRAVFRHLPGDADRRHRICPARGRVGRRPQRGVLRPDRPSGDRSDAGSGGHYRQGRHHAAGQVPLRAGGGYPGPGRLRRRRHLRAAPAPV